MNAIRDDGGAVLAPKNVWSSADEFLDAMRRTAAQARLDRTIGQAIRLVVICEAAGMAPQLARTANPFGVTVLSGGGFDSLTDKYKICGRAGGPRLPDRSAACRRSRCKRREYVSRLPR